MPLKALKSDQASSASSQGVDFRYVNLELLLRSNEILNYEIVVETRIEIGTMSDIFCKKFFFRVPGI